MLFFWATHFGQGIMHTMPVFYHWAMFLAKKRIKEHSKTWRDNSYLCEKIQPGSDTYLSICEYNVRNPKQSNWHLITNIYRNHDSVRNTILE